MHLRDFSARILSLKVALKLACTFTIKLKTTIGLHCSPLWFDFEQELDKRVEEAQGILNATVVYVK